MYFISEEHEVNFNKLIKKYHKSDSEYCSAYYILSHPDIFYKTEKHIADDGIYFKKMYDCEDFSSSFLFLVKVAHNLFNHSIKLDLTDFLLLDEGNYRMFLQALDIRRI